MKTNLLLFFLVIAVLSNGQTTGIFDRSETAFYDPVGQTYLLQTAEVESGSSRTGHLTTPLQGDFIIRTIGKFVAGGKGDYFGLMIRSDKNRQNYLQLVSGKKGETSVNYSLNGRQFKKVLNDAADVLEIERKGDMIYLRTAKMGALYKTDSVAIELEDEILAGLLVGSSNGTAAKAIFSNVRIVYPANDFREGRQKYLGSQLEILDPETGLSQIIYQSPRSLQAPNWMLNGDTIIYNSGGLLYKLSLKTRSAIVLKTGRVRNNNNDHVISFDGNRIGLSGSENPGAPSLVYTVPISGGEPLQITETGPSYLHGWSPDGKFLTFVGRRNDDFDVYKIPSGGGKEIRLTTTKGLDDGPEYSPDGKYIYFNSVRNGGMHIYRMHPDGTAVEQLTNDSLHNWFPHISPDGKWIVFLSFNLDVDPSDHPFYKHVYLRLMPAEGGQPKVIAYLYGGQGTVNTPSWSPDSKRISFISNSDFLSPLYPTEGRRDKTGE